MSHRPITLVILFVCVNWFCTPQQELKTDALNRVLLQKSDTVFQFYTIKSTDTRIQPESNSYYYWFKPDTILVTNNGFDGKLLHGDYTVFYPNKNLKEKGTFQNGLKTGEWKSWFDNGEVQSVSHWKLGRQEGLFTEFDRSGKALRKGSYKRGRLRGDLQELGKDTTTTQQNKRGKRVIEKANKDSTLQSDSAHVQKK